MNPSRMSPERSIIAGRQVARIGERIADDEVVRLAEALCDLSDDAADLVEQRRLQGAGRAEDGDDEFDKVMDASIHQLYDDYTGCHKYHAATRSIWHKPLKRFGVRHFPGGVGHITAARFETELHRIERLVDDLHGPSAPLVEAMGWQQKLAAIESHLDGYREALAARRKVTGSDVRAALDDAHRALCRLVAYVMWAYGDEDEKREELMMPIDDQQDRIAAIMRARRAGRSGAVAGTAATGEGADEQAVDGDAYEDDIEALLEGDEAEGDEAGDEAEVEAGAETNDEGPEAGAEAPEAPADEAPGERPPLQPLSVRGGPAEEP